METEVHIILYIIVKVRPDNGIRTRQQPRAQRKAAKEARRLHAAAN